MRQMGFCLVLAAALYAGAADAGGDRGLGIVVGDPTGVSAKKWLDGQRAWVGAAGWDFSGDGFLYVHLDHLFHSSEVVRQMELEPDRGRLLFYWGLGGRVLAGDDTRLGLRVPVGLDYVPASPSLEVFLEVAPLLELVPKTEFDVGAALGLRFFL